jgi:acyl-CoA thioester hydrolase
MNDKPNELREFPSVVRLPVQWGDQDGFGHVNNVIALRWFETARIAFLEQNNMGDLMHDRELGPIVASVTCNYRRQLFYPDDVLVAARLGELGRSSLTIEHAVYSCSQQAVVYDGQTVVVIFDYTANRPRRIPDELRAKLLATTVTASPPGVA